MCSPTCIQFVQTHLSQKDINGKKVLEVGSLDVNGSTRSIIEALHPLNYLGVDIVNGPGVDEICDVTDLVTHFGKESFDVVIATELLEHVRNWRDAMSNIKNALKLNGTLLITTRSKGQMYHGYPFDFWRYEVEDMGKIFSDFSIDVIEKDSRSPGVFFKAHKTTPFVENYNETLELYSIITLRRCRNISNRAFRFSKNVLWPLAVIFDKTVPAFAKNFIKKILSGIM